jgi:hypothetical protein
MPKGSLVVQIKCLKCGSAVLEVPDDTSDDPLVVCENGHVIGPYSALKAELERQTHTVIQGFATEVTLKPVK